VRADLSSAGGPKDARVLDGIAQEIDIETGEVLFDASFPPLVESYRAFRFPWSGYPSDDPAISVEAGSDDKVTLYASWNGATEVATWQVLAGPNPEMLEPVGSAAPREGFETAITVRSAGPYIGVQARDSSGRALGTSRAAVPRSWTVFWIGRVATGYRPLLSIELESGPYEPAQWPKPASFFGDTFRSAERLRRHSHYFVLQTFVT
jgi:hypothetical protein